MVGAQIVLVVGTCLLIGGIVSERLHVAAPLLLLLLGALAGGVLGVLPEARTIALPPEVVLVLFLPVLLKRPSFPAASMRVAALG